MRTRNFLVAWLVASVVGWLLRMLFLNEVVDTAMRVESDPVKRMNLYSHLALISMVLHGVVLFAILEGLAVARAFRAIEEPEEEKS